jgi:hypothetical protein
LLLAAAMLRPGLHIRPVVVALLLLLLLTTGCGSWAIAGLPRCVLRTRRSSVRSSVDPSEGDRSRDAGRSVRCRLTGAPCEGGLRVSGVPPLHCRPLRQGSCQRRRLGGRVPGGRACGFSAARAPTAQHQGARWCDRRSRRSLVLWPFHICHEIGISIRHRTVLSQNRLRLLVELNVAGRHRGGTRAGRPEGCPRKVLAGSVHL